MITTDLAATESDARHERMDRVAVLYGEITAATREFLRALAESDRHRDWAEESFASCADWLAWRIGVTRNTASEKVRAARALEGLPLISEAMGRGELSFSKVRALTRVATPESEAELLGYAKACSTATLERLVRGWKTLGRVEEAKAERLRHRLRTFSVFPDGEGMYVVKGRLMPEVAAVLMRAVEAASDALYAGGAPREDSAVEPCTRDGADDRREPQGGDDAEDRSVPRTSDDAEGRPEPEQLRADALGLLAERALAAGFGNRGAASVAKEHEDGVPVSGSRAERYQVVLHVEPETLRETSEPGMSELEDGTRVSAETSRRLSCDAGLVEVRKGEDGSVLDVGRRTRTIPPAVRRALEARDRGCRFPGCGLRFTDAHHIVHWADGGETNLRNTVLLCRRHHRQVHEGGCRVFSDADGRVVFFTPSGKAIAASPPMPALAPDPVQDLVERNRARGVEPHWRSGIPRYRRDGDVPWDVEAGALEALERTSVSEPNRDDAHAA